MVSQEREMIVEGNATSVRTGHHDGHGRDTGEVMSDVRLALAPVSLVQARGMVKSLRDIPF